MEQSARTTKIIKELLGFLGISEPDIVITHDDLANLTYFTATIEDPKEIIGQQGATLEALQHIIKKIAEKTATGDAAVTPFVFDVNGYQAKKVEILKGKIKVLAERARSFKNSVPLDPMSAYERLLVHTLLAHEQDLSTESEGEGKTRHIVIKYTGS